MAHPHPFQSNDVTFDREHLLQQQLTTHRFSFSNNIEPREEDCSYPAAQYDDETTAQQNLYASQMSLLCGEPQTQATMTNNWVAPSFQTRQSFDEINIAQNSCFQLEPQNSMIPSMSGNKTTKSKFNQISQNSTPYKSPLQHKRQGINDSQTSGVKSFGRGNGMKNNNKLLDDQKNAQCENNTGNYHLGSSQLCRFSMTETKDQHVKNSHALQQNVLQPLPLKETDLMNSPLKQHQRVVNSAQKNQQYVAKMPSTCGDAQQAEQIKFTYYPDASIKENSPNSLGSADEPIETQKANDYQQTHYNATAAAAGISSSSQGHFFQTSLLQEDSSSNMILHNESSLLLNAGGDNDVSAGLRVKHQSDQDSEERVNLARQSLNVDDESKQNTYNKSRRENTNNSVTLNIPSSQKSPLVSQIKFASQLGGLGPSSLLSDCYKQPSTGAFQGDRFVPMRPEEQNHEGTQQFTHEQMQMISSKKRKRQKIVRGTNPYSSNFQQEGFDSDEELLLDDPLDYNSQRNQSNNGGNGNASSDDSSSERTLSANSSSNSDDDEEMDDEEQIRHKRKSRQRNAKNRRELYQDLLQQQCFGGENVPQLQKNNLSCPLPATPLVDQTNDFNRGGLCSLNKGFSANEAWMNVEAPLPPLNKLAEIATKKAEKPKRKTQILKFKKRDSKVYMSLQSKSTFASQESATGTGTGQEDQNIGGKHHGCMFQSQVIDESQFQNENLAPVNLLDLQRDANLHIDRSLMKTRKISKVPYKVLDAPQLQDDFYLNLVDWSATNVLAVGLQGAVYIWSAANSQVQKLCEVNVESGDQITSVNWSQKGNHLAVGTHQGKTQIWDAVNMRLIREYASHLGRVSALAWNQTTLTTGSRDGSILQRDLRMNGEYYLRQAGHRQEVCGLKWSYDNMQLASGGNDNKLMIWQLHSSQPLVRFNQHTAAVKAIGWSPHQSSLLATGGGTADRHIRFWNTLTLQPIFAVDTGSQVCNLMFSRNSQEIVSTHGYSQNQVILWKFPTMQKIRTLTGHHYRVLYLSMSPDGENIVTGAGDETLRFWNIFPQKSGSTLRGGSSQMGGRPGNQLFPSSMDLR